MEDSQAIDVPISKLRPRRERQVAKRDYDRILATIKAVGLIEPLIVFPEGENYEILDGTICYRALLELGVQVVPCILGKQREALTGNRMVNRVTPLQENRMIEKSLTTVDEATIAATFGISDKGHRMKRALLQQLHPDVAAAFDRGKITRPCAWEMTHVKPERQKDIVSAMEGHKDYSIAFVRALILKTPVPLREKHRRKHDPWEKNGHKKGELLQQLTEAEQKHDFYSRLYKQYTVDLLRLAIYARELLTNARVRAYLDQHHPTIVAQFEGVIAEVKG